MNLLCLDIKINMNNKYIYEMNLSIWYIVDTFLICIPCCVELGASKPQYIMITVVNERGFH